MHERIRRRGAAWLAARRRVRAAESGVIAVMLALVTCFVFVPLGGLVVDLGMQRIARSDMQATADAIALDMARSLGAGIVPTDALATTSAVGTSGTVGTAAALHVFPGYLSSASSFVSNQSLGCGSRSGATVSDSYFTTTVPSGKSANAVLVTASSTVRFSMMGGTGSVCRSAIAATVSAACYDVGSYAAAVSTSNSALINPVLRQMAQQSSRFSNGGTVSAIDYKGLAQSSINLDQVAANLGIASVSQLATSTVALHSFYVAVAQAMVQPANSTNLSALNSLASLTGSSSGTVDLSKVLQISSGVSGLANVNMNALDLVGGSIAAINGTNVASINVGSTTLPGVSNANAQVTLIQGPHHFCGGPGDSATTATSPSLTQQLGVSMTAQLNPETATISVPAISGLLGSTTASVTLPNNVTTTVSVAPTSTTLTSVTCAGSKGIGLDVTNGLATVGLNTYLSNIVINANLLNITIAGIKVASVNAKIAINAQISITATVSPSGVVHVSILVPPQQFDTAYPSSSTGVGLGAPTILGTPSVVANSNVSVAGVISAGGYIALTAAQQSQILNAVATSVVTPMFDNTNSSSFVSTVINPVLGMLGAQVGGSDIILDSTPAPGCGQPGLKG